MGEPPRPEEAAYPDYLVALHLDAIVPSSGSSRHEALVFVWAMQDYQLRDGAFLHVGDQVEMQIRPWADVPPNLETLTRGEIFDRSILNQAPFWGEEILKR